MVDYLGVGRYHWAMINSGNNSEKLPEGGLLQSARWTAFLHAKGQETFDVRGGALFGVVQTLQFVGRYGYMARVPQGVIKELIGAVRSVSQDLRLGWVRADFSSMDDVKLLRELDCYVVKAPHDTQPESNLIMDISAPEEELLLSMKQKTRYNIRMALKKGVRVKAYRFGDQEFERYLKVFFQLVQETAVRKGVRFHTYDHYGLMFAVLPPENIALYVGKFDEDIVAINIVSYYKETATYLHGAFGGAHSSMGVPFLLQWQAIFDARSEGYKYYDFGGFFPQTSDKGKAGITRFKKGFAPKTPPTETAGSWDIVFSPLRYKMYRALQRCKRFFG